MKDISVLIKPVSGSCNLKCKYCFYKDEIENRKIRNYGKMTKSVMEKLIDNIFLDLEKGDSVNFAFQGGEPTLIKIEFYKSFIDYVKRKNINKNNVSYSLQTNGIDISDKWCSLFKTNNFLIGLSLDCTKYFHDKNRITLNDKGSFQKVMDSKKYLEKYRVDYNILSVLTNEMAEYPREIFQFILDEKIKYIQFIPCMDELYVEKKSSYTLTPEKFAYFYKELFILWKKEWDRGNYISINFFDNVISLLKNGKAPNCGFTGNCSPQYVIEANGDVFPCDFYVLDDYYSGNITKNTIRDIFYNSSMQNFINSKQLISKYCKDCSIYNICRGGCKRQRYNMYLNNEENYCGYLDFLISCQDDIADVVQTLKKRG
ncbi:radical SAM/SPASM domain-containing protein [Miniphocaeibacter massiliensis]|uniref:radical SAM/SPASM domain-containing protein n=1 Tax=Miniphocaeibacter massiliensis TaxID=2041841 RepID=UPI000C1B9CD0|nr:SPASM domain-containing protein [Miniphocaeibacter massiliensis]